MADDREERIRQRAYDLWQREGAPEGRDQDHWHEAVAPIDAEMAEGNEVAPGTAAAAGLAGRGDDLDDRAGQLRIDLRAGSSDGRRRRHAHG